MLTLILAMTAVDAGDALKKAMRHYQLGEFAASIAVLDALNENAQPPAINAKSRFLLGINFLALRNTKRAEQSFKQALEQDPDFAAPTLLAPAVREAFERVRAAFVMKADLKHVAPASASDTKGATLAFSLLPESERLDLVVGYRLQGENTYNIVSVQRPPNGPRLVEMPAAYVRTRAGNSLQYYARVKDPSGRTIAELGSGARPVTVPVERAKVFVPVYKRWWVWTLVAGGLLAGAGAVTAAVLLQPPAYGSGDVHVTSAR